MNLITIYIIIVLSIIILGNLRDDHARIHSVATNCDNVTNGD